ncbi:hypothetical protein PPACK8108_LOCUS23681 [Phakopsora pachyrhizi]|uniref:Uncharacterized protein n=1 Tax=Phakopsora pachyrhizi TaxID=170000 RepID=A0AAV0BQA1_PHAPC|nr:hypothetical protein PPACK8108_LOCUS23681 [Phakopsora pachyrhizi]
MLSRLSFGWAWAWLGLLTWQGRLAGRIDWLGLSRSGQIGLGWTGQGRQDRLVCAGQGRSGKISRQCILAWAGRRLAGRIDWLGLDRTGQDRLAWAGQVRAVFQAG